jgi:2-phospho-L-lactate guanylyltransferase
VTTGVVVVVPVKALAAAKSRLAVRFSPDERAQIVLRLFDHVMTATREAGSIDRCLVVSADPAVLARAMACAAEVLEEPTTSSSSSHNDALELGRAVVGQRWNPAALLVLAGDLPLLTAADLDAMVALGVEPGTIVLAPDRSGMGTNAMLMRPPDALAFHFGLNSFAAHTREAAARGLRLHVYRGRGTAHDVDLPEDLDALDELAWRSEAAEERPRLR